MNKFLWPSNQWVVKTPYEQELCGLCRSPGIDWVNTSRRSQWAGHEERVK